MRRGYIAKHVRFFSCQKFEKDLTKILQINVNMAIVKQALNRILLQLYLIAKIC